MSDPQHIVTEQSIIGHAIELNGGPIDNMVTGHKFNDKLSAALYVIAGHGFDDDIISDPDHGDSATRIDRFVMLISTTGFVDTRTFDTPEHAKWHMDDIRRDMAE